MDHTCTCACTRCTCRGFVGKVLGALDDFAGGLGQELSGLGLAEAVLERPRAQVGVRRGSAGWCPEEATHRMGGPACNNSPRQPSFAARRPSEGLIDPAPHAADGWVGELLRRCATAPWLLPLQVRQHASRQLATAVGKILGAVEEGQRELSRTVLEPAVQVGAAGRWGQCHAAAVPRDAHSHSPGCAASQPAC